MVTPWGQRARLLALSTATACVAAGAAVTLVRGGSPREMAAAIGSLTLSPAAGRGDD